MMRLCLVLSVLLVLSAISLITARFQSRQLFMVMDRLGAQAHELEMDWRRLQLDRAELARNARIDQIARQNLGMRAITPQRTLYVDARSPERNGNRSNSGRSAP